VDVGFVGIGAMGAAMAEHVIRRGRDTVAVFDVRPEAAEPLIALGARGVADLADLRALAELIVVMVVDDAQVLATTERLAAAGGRDALIAVASTVHPNTMQAGARIAAAGGLGVIDAPVCFGLRGARDGQLATLCGGDAAQVDRARPVLEAYSRAVHHIGPLGSGQLAKTVNNMLHWAHCVSNYEALLLGKRYGLDAQKLREVLLACPATNGTLEMWDDTRFTWPEKDMEIALALAEDGHLPLPLYGQIDQLVRLLSAEAVKDLLYGEAADYLGRRYGAIEPQRQGRP
jgi:3-hydroxyisobutyrate dehydrogenase-like beta-hydroxyacid dehydrogenase